MWIYLFLIIFGIFANIIGSKFLPENFEETPEETYNRLSKKSF
jgi:hypothetical protein